MSREIPYDPEVICDICGKKGANDFMGDYICPACYFKVSTTEVPDPELKRAAMSEKQWCPACGKWGDHGSGSCPEITHPVEKLSLRSEWISVKDRLPKHGLAVLCQGVELQKICYRSHITERWYYYPCGNITEIPTHWMPLPAPPTL